MQCQSKGVLELERDLYRCTAKGSVVSGAQLLEQLESGSSGGAKREVVERILRNR